MNNFLIFQLYGPMQAYGDVAVGEIRPGYRHPGRSAIIGLLSSCLGIKRNDSVKLQKMSELYGVAVRVDSEGIPLRDFHTVQTPRQQAGRFFNTRNEELVTKIRWDEQINTIVSSRDYIMDALFGVCVWSAGDESPYNLEEIKAAMEKPKFTPYLGRKSCPPSLPFNPKVVSANSIAEAFDHLLPDVAFLTSGMDLKMEKVRIYWDIGPEPGVGIDQFVSRRDKPINRITWQFEERIEYKGTVRLPSKEER